MTQHNIIIDPEFRSLIPPLSQEESEQLECNIIRDGCREPLVIWEEERILLDGHHRLDICVQHKIDFQTVGVALPDREAAADWIDANQLGRRNLTPDQASLLRGRRYNRVKKREGFQSAGPGRGKTLPHFEGVFSGETAERLATQHGVSRATIERDGQFADAVKNLKKDKPDIERRIITSQAPPKAAIILASKILDKEPEQAQAILSGEKTLTQVKKIIKKQELIKSVSNETCGIEELKKLIDAGKKFHTIYADPPWDYSNQSTRSSTSEQYPTMSIEEIAALPVTALTHPDAHLHLWTTNAFLFESKAIIEAWGFEYKSMFIWVKPQLGIGNYWRVSHEILLFAIKGNCPFFDQSQRSWLELDRSDHSHKPAEIRNIIEKVSPPDWLELFGREIIEGWTVWGNEIDRSSFNDKLRS